jgi:hypothetical protein
MAIASSDGWLIYLQNASHWQWPLVLLVGVHQKPLINIEAAVGDEDVDEEVEEPNIEQVAPQHLNARLMRGRTYPVLLNSCETKNVNWMK